MFDEKERIRKEKTQRNIKYSRMEKEDKPAYDPIKYVKKLLERIRKERKMK